MGTGPLDAPVNDFVDAIAGAVGALGSTTAALDVAADAADLVAAFIDADGRHTDDELWAYLGAFAGRFETQLARSTPSDVRAAGLVTGKSAWLDAPSVLFRLLLDADRRDRTALATTYYRLAMRIAHTVASLDLHPSDDELDAIDRFRTMLLAEVRDAGVAPPRSGAAAEPGRERPDAGPAAPPAGEGGPEPLGPARPVDEVLAELDALVGLGVVKHEVRLLTNLLQVQRLRAERGLPVIDTSRHLVFTGNPGTGKTTVARLLGQAYRSLGVASKGQLVETDRSGMVAGYVGQTAIKTREVVERALGGVLLIDEAHALARGGENDFGKEAIDTLVKLMEDHRDDLAVIACGYTDEMQGFLDANPGLRSRFPKVVHFPDYTDDELVAIFVLMGDKHRYRPDASALDALRGVLAAQERDKGFGNARLVRNLFEAAVSRHASRVVGVASPTEADLTTLTAADLRE